MSLELTTNGSVFETGNDFTVPVSGGYPWPANYSTVYWNSYPVYVCTDKTKKAIEILKALQAAKIIDVKSVPRFIELTEKITEIL